MSHCLEHQTNTRRSINRGSFTKRTIATSQWGSAMVESGNGIRWEETNVVTTGKVEICMCSLHPNKSFPQRHSSTVFITASWLCSHVRFMEGRCDHWSLEELQWYLGTNIYWLCWSIPRTAAESTLSTPPSPLSHRQVQLDCQAELRLPPSLSLFIFLSVCLKNQGKNNLHGHKFTISPLIRVLSTPPTGKKCFHLYVRTRVGHSPRVKAIYSSTVTKLHSSCRLARLPVEVDRPAASSGHLGQLKGHACHISHDHADVVNLTYL